MFRLRVCTRAGYCGKKGKGRKGAKWGNSRTFRVI